tara:strand:- start:140 stop:316 length:177 start_codon:yes stop_codon:yes gene_type:complete
MIMARLCGVLSGVCLEVKVAIVKGIVEVSLVVVVKINVAPGQFVDKLFNSSRIASEEW